MKVRPRFDHGLSKLLKVDAITIYPFIFYAKEERFVSASLRQHERTHISQVDDHMTAWKSRWLGWISFYLSYLLYYLAGLIRYRSHNEAYWYIPYEIEARHQEEDNDGMIWHDH